MGFTGILYKYHCLSLNKVIHLLSLPFSAFLLSLLHSLFFYVFSLTTGICSKVRCCLVRS